MIQREIIVDQFEMKKASYPDILISEGLGACIAIGLYHSETKSGYMMHEAHFQWADLDGKINKIQRDYGDLSKIEVFAAGNSLASHDGDIQRKFEISSRSYVEEILLKYFQKSQMNIKWAFDDHVMTLSLDTSTGRFILDNQSLKRVLI